MPLSIPYIIAVLRKVTLTPDPDITKYLGGAFKDLLRSITKCLPQLPQPVSAADLTEILTFFIVLPHSSIFFRQDFPIGEAKEDSPQILQGALVIEPCLRYLIGQALLDAEELSGTSSLLIKTILDCWFGELRNILPKEPYLNKKPEKQNSPLFRYHIDSHENAKIDKATPPYLYLAYVYEIHKAIRGNENQGIDADTHYSYVLTARYFFDHSPYDIKAKKDHPSEVPQEFIDKLAKNLDKALKGMSDDDPLTDFAKAHKGRLEKLLANAKLISRPHGGSESGQGGRAPKKEGVLDRRDTVDGTTQTETDPPHLAATELDDDNPEDDEEEARVGEYECNDTSVYYSPDEPDVVPKKPSLRPWGDLFNLRSFLFPMDPRFLNIFHYMLIYLRLVTLWGRSSFDNATILFIELCIHTGIHSRRLLNLTISTEEPTEETPVLRQLGGRYYILVKSLLKKMKPPEDGECLKTSDVIWVPVPLSLGARIAKVNEHGSEQLFRYRSTSGKTKKLNLVEIKTFINREINTHYSMFKLHISLPKICTSFLPQYSGLGLNPLICTLITAQDYLKLYKSRIHYVHIEHKRLMQDYLQTFERLVSAILGNLSECIDNGFIEINGDPRPLLRVFLEGEPHNPLPCDSGSLPAEEPPFGYGSPLICSSDYIVDIVNKLKQSIISCRDMIKRHNLYICYLYLALQFATALRPRNNPDITFHDFFADFGVVAISDKQSAQFHEERFSLLAYIITRLVMQLKENLHELRKHIAIKYGTYVLEDSDKVFFFINGKTGRRRDLTLKKYRSLLTDAGISYTLPPNMPRHWVRNYLEKAGIFQEIAEALMAHHHLGKELLNQSSAALPSKAIKVLLPRIEALLSQLGFEVIAYKPKGFYNVRGQY